MITTYPLPDGSVCRVTTRQGRRTVARLIDGRSVWRTTVDSAAGADAVVLEMTACPGRFITRKTGPRQLPAGAWIESLGDLLNRPEPAEAFEVLVMPGRFPSWMSLGWLTRPDRERARDDAHLMSSPSSMALIVRYRP